MGFMAGKKALVVGVASDRSIATGIAEAFAREGAELAFTYQNDKLKGRVTKLAERLGQNPELCFPCDVSSDDEIHAVFENLGKHWDGLDILVHSVGFAPRDQLEGGFTEAVTREGFAIAHDISSYRLAALKPVRPWLQILRGLTLAGATPAFVIGAQTVDYADAIAILYAYPFLLVIVAAMFLGEKASWPVWIGVAGGGEQVAPERREGLLAARLRFAQPVLRLEPHAQEVAPA